MCQTLHPSPPTPPASYSGELARQRQDNRLPQATWSGQGLEADRNAIQGLLLTWAEILGRPQEGASDTVNPEQSPLILI